MDKHVYAKKAEIIKMFENMHKSDESSVNFDNSSKNDNKAIKKVLTKSKYTKINRK